MTLLWALMAAGLWLGSGLPSLLAGRRSRIAQGMTTLIGCTGSVLGIAAACVSLASGSSDRVQISGPLPGSLLHFDLDPLAAFFLLPILVVGALGSVYGTGYWRADRHPRTAVRVQCCYGLLVGALCMLILAADAIAFLFAWEVMAISAFFLVSTEEQKPAVREAGWIYLVAAHVGTLLLFATFALLRVAVGSFEFHRLDPARAGVGIRGAIFLTALGGFGLKAGMMPLHFWLPSAHAHAPSHVSAMLSGVVLKVGIYGLLRTLTLLPVPPIGWGALVLILGTVSAVMGVLYALGQHDLKRLLAYHSVENIGIILMGLGLALIGQARGRAELVALGMGGCLLHVWNHSLFKSLLFFAAGSVVHGVRTREIDRMGGLAKRMPGTAAFLFVGAAAICGLPPLNGFVSEFLLYVGLFRSLDGAAGAALAVPALALVGALALACFVKAYGGVFLGNSRGRSLEVTHESSAWMRMPMAALAICCAAIGFVPVVAVGPLRSVLGQMSGTMRRDAVSGALAPLASLTPLTAPLAALLLAIVLVIVLRLRLGAISQRVTPTWDCGYAAPSARMQYTASSFAQILVRLVGSVLRPVVHAPRPTGVFPRGERFESHVDDPVLSGALTPLWRRVRGWFGGMRFIQAGSVQRYILYILLILVVLLLSMAPFREVLRAMLGGEVH
jgi:hydrogenase-4 component B